MSSSFPTTRVLVALLAVILISLPFGAASANPKQDSKKAKPAKSTSANAKKVKKLLREANRLAQQQKFIAAASRFESAYKLEASKSILFGWAQAERMAGNCRQAYFNYARVLQMTPSAKQVEIVQYGMRECERVLKSAEIKEIRAQVDDFERATKEEEKQAALDRQRSELEARQRAQSEKQRKELERQRKLREAKERARANRPSRVPAYALMIAGGVAALAGGGAYYLADDFTKRTAANYEEQQDHNDKAEQWELYSTIGFATGGGLVVTGVAYLLLVGDGDEEVERQAIHFMAGPGDIGLGLGGQF